MYGQLGLGDGTLCIGLRMGFWIPTGEAKRRTMRGDDSVYCNELQERWYILSYVFGPHGRGGDLHLNSGRFSGTM